VLSTTKFIINIINIFNKTQIELKIMSLFKNKYEYRLHKEKLIKIDAVSEPILPINKILLIANKENKILECMNKFLFFSLSPKKLFRKNTVIKHSKIAVGISNKLNKLNIIFYLLNC
jgi:hypothetical protein